MPTNAEKFKEALTNAIKVYHPDWEVRDDNPLKSSTHRWMKKDGNLPTPRSFVELLKVYAFKPEVEEELRRLFYLAKESPYEEADRQPDANPAPISQPDANPAPISQPDANPAPRSESVPVPTPPVSLYSPIPASPSFRIVWLQHNALPLALLAGLVLLLIVARPRPETPAQNRDWTPQYSTHEGYQLALVPPGCFIMGNTHGDADEKPAHEVCFSKPFWIGVTEVTNGYYGSPPEEPCNLNQINPSLGLVNQTASNYPRNCLTWEDANNFCASKGMRLPTEAEWEYAARGPESWLYPWGNDATTSHAAVRTNFSNNAIPGDTQPVGSKPYDTSWVGAKDMAGNLREFTSTIYDTVTNNGEKRFGYPYNPDDGRESLVNEGTSSDIVNRKSTTTLRVVRGGSFDFGIAQATSTTRIDEWYDFLWNDYGFRCALDFTGEMPLPLRQTVWWLLLAAAVGTSAWIGWRTLIMRKASRTSSMSKRG